MGVMNPGLVMRNIIPVVMAGVLGIYGLIVAVILSGSSELLLLTSTAETLNLRSGGSLLGSVFLSGSRT